MVVLITHGLMLPCPLCIIRALAAGLEPGKPNSFGRELHFNVTNTSGARSGQSRCARSRENVPSTNPNGDTSPGALPFDDAGAGAVKIGPVHSCR